MFTHSLDPLPDDLTQNRWFKGLHATHQAALIKATHSIGLRDGQLAITQGAPLRKRGEGLMVLHSGLLKYRLKTQRVSRLYWDSYSQVNGLVSCRC